MLKANNLSRFVVLLLALASPLPEAVSQESPISTLRVDTRLVDVLAIVRGESGGPVPGLTREAFSLREDGKPQELIYFSQGSDLPLTLALMVDTSSSQTLYIPNEIAASWAFFPALMTQPGDRGVLMQFDTQVMELADLTNSVSKLQKALPRLSEKRGELAYGTRLYDAICGVAQLELGNQMGRRAMVILTDGGDAGSEAKISTAIAEAQRADIMIYSVYYSSGGGNKHALERLSKATGGRVFTVGPDKTLAQVYVEIGNDMRLAYEIGYRPPVSQPKKFHRIELRTNDKKLIVQSREGYFAR